ncbi:PREDICTED: protein hunchback-like [Cyphomyrmex costatus]|uniref:protein hunchback-like n=1 Tax=Cyphomyrmex costatus TaxID=456900 RepID=UPI0008522B83|nr:PREDICTED: protein hunchback-like [Cyphomyrmex costatus]
MKKCQKHVESQRQTLDQQQHQQQTIAEEQRCPPFLPLTTPAWGDINVSKQAAGETNNNFNFLFAHSIPSTSDARTCNLLSSRNNSLSSTSNLIKSTMNNNQSTNEQQLPRKCKLCSYTASSRAEYIEHVIAHSTFVKSLYVENDSLNEYADDEEYDDSGNELHSKGKKRNKTSKPKPCSKCDFTAKTKLALWLHLRQHFTQEECSGFVCTSCPFATTLKHHMTFHWFSAHDDFKAFMCTECSYACVSKSMLTSHMKTHSEVYQYNCGNCSYKTKFCNAMKKHLKDNGHQAGLVLNPDGTPNPFATIDVYGNKRGPRRKTFIEEKKELTDTIDDMPTNLIMTPPTISSISTSSASVLTTPISSSTILDLPESNMALMSPVRMPSPRSPIQTVQRSPVRIPTPITPHPIIANMLNDFFNKLKNQNGFNRQLLLENSPFNFLCHLLFQDLATRSIVDDKEQGQIFRLLQNVYKYLTNDTEHVASISDTKDELPVNARIDEPSTSTMPISESQSAMEVDVNLDQPLDLSMSAMVKREEISHQPQSTSFSKRKRKAVKLEYSTINEKKFHIDDNAVQTRNTNQICTESSLSALLTASQSDLQENNMTHNINIYRTSFICYHCCIIFANEIMYAVHMSFHQTKNPFTCALATVTDRY